MERDLNNDEFELFLKQKADQLKLYPSDKSWKGIYNSLHPGMKWFKIGGTLLVLSTLLVIYQETSFFNSSNSSLKNTRFDNSISSNTSIARQVPESLNSSAQVKSPANLTASAINSAENAVSNKLNKDVAGLWNDAFEVSDHIKAILLRNNTVAGLTAPIIITAPAKHAAAVAAEDNQTEVTADNDFLKPITSAAIGNTFPGEEEVSVNDLNWLQEMAAIKLTPQKKSRFNLQFYFSPTVSYRRLADNKNSAHTGLAGSSIVSTDPNINRYVDHNPAIGAELGSNVLFALTRNLTIKSGLQLNYSRYNIKAFKTSYEKASIALNTAGPVADTISSYTSLRNLGGYAPEELQNQYLQVSVPVGAELKLLGNKRLQFSVAGTLQPTFLLFSDTYLLSTNYLNYTKEPSLVRKWNVHSSVEAFLSYKIGGLRWQVGPQFRYQLMSSYNDRYPIKEYLFEYGVKFGISKTLR